MRRGKTMKCLFLSLRVWRTMLFRRVPGTMTHLQPRPMKTTGFTTLERPLLPKPGRPLTNVIFQLRRSPLMLLTKDPSAEPTALLTTVYPGCFTAVPAWVIPTVCRGHGNSSWISLGASWLAQAIRVSRPTTNIAAANWDLFFCFIEALLQYSYINVSV